MVQILLLLTLVLNPSISSACQCDGTYKLEENIRDSAQIFKGRVIEVKGVQVGSHFVPTDYIFSVGQRWKGKSTRKVTLTAAYGSSRCQFEFQKGEDYLVFASNEDFDGEKALIASRCGHTEWYSASSPVLTQVQRIVRNSK